LRHRQQNEYSPVAPESAALVNSGLVKAADYRDQERHKSLKQGEIAVTISTDRANLVLELFEAYYKRVYCFSRKSLAPSAAEDIAQEVFTRLLQVRALEEKTLTSSYLIKIADNLIKRGYNKNQRKNRYIDSQREEAIRDVRRYKPTEARWSNHEITEALSSLPTHERDAVRLVVCEGLSYEEASESLGVPVSTVNNWKYRGVNKLKELSELTEMKTSA
jgi:RNA polymerase sigma-70 factor (ECF subfamily)